MSTHSAPGQMGERMSATSQPADGTASELKTKDIREYVVFVRFRLSWIWEYVSAANDKRHRAPFYRFSFIFIFIFIFIFFRTHFSNYNLAERFIHPDNSHFIFNRANIEYRVHLIMLHFPLFLMPFVLSRHVDVLTAAMAFVLFYLVHWCNTYVRRAERNPIKIQT